MKLQIDTTISIHTALDKLYDDIVSKYRQINADCSSVHASTFTKKEFLFSLINDCCAFMAKLYTTKSFIRSYEWIDKYSCYKKRFGQRIHSVFSGFILTHYKPPMAISREEKDCLIAEDMISYFRILIPELWERFDANVHLPLTNRTHCLYAQQEPVETNELFSVKVKKKCDVACGCTVVNMLKGEKARAMKLLEYLNQMPDGESKKTKELLSIQEFLSAFYINEDYDECYKQCPSGYIGDLIIALETQLDRTFITTNSKESKVISAAIGQKYVIISKG